MDFCLAKLYAYSRNMPHMRGAHHVDVRGARVSLSVPAPFMAASQGGREAAMGGLGIFLCAPYDVGMGYLWCRLLLQVRATPRFPVVPCRTGCPRRQPRAPAHHLPSPHSALNGAPLALATHRPKGSAQDVAREEAMRRLAAAEEPADEE